jgi:hypothetical protein
VRGDTWEIAGRLGERGGYLNGLSRSCNFAADLRVTSATCIFSPALGVALDDVVLLHGFLMCERRH